MRMSIRALRGTAISIVALTVLALPLRAQGDPQRDGLWFSLGMGSGSLACDHCGARLSGLAGQFTLGTAINARWLLGVGANGWTKSFDGRRLAMNAMTAQARYYPSADTRFFFAGGVGVSSLDLGLARFGSRRAMGKSALLGVGYDIRVSHATSLTAFWTGVAGYFDDNRANFGQLGLSVTRY
jgi:hypothetical protein